MEIGDKVRIIDCGKLYTTYRSMFFLMGFRNPYEDKHYDIYDDTFTGEDTSDNVFTIFAKHQHEDFPKTTVCGIENANGLQLLIGENGLALVDEAKTKVKIKIKAKKKYVYVMYDGLSEKVLCVHDKSGAACDICDKVRKRKSSYPLQEHKRLIKTTEK